MTSSTTARRTPRTTLVLVGCVVVLALVCFLSLAVGSKPTTLPQVVDALTGRPDAHLANVLDARIERTILAVVIGAAFSAIIAAVVASLAYGTASVLQAHGAQSVAEPTTDDELATLAAEGPDPEAQEGTRPVS